MADNRNIHLGLRQGWGGVESPFHMSEEALRRHLYVVGKTGSGKTSLLKTILVQLLEQKRGFALLDPHGDLAEEILNLVPSEMAQRVVYFHPGDLAFPVAWNILANIPFDDRPRVASGLVSAFKHVWGDSWGPRLEYILYNAIRALLDAEHTSILGLPKMLSNEVYRHWVVRQIKDPFVKAFWEDEFEKYDHRFRQEAIAPIQNKVGQLATNPVLRNIVGQVKCKLDIPFIMENGGVFIANLSKGSIGEEPSNLIGALLVSEFQRAAVQRASMPESSRRDFTLVIDEFQNFTSKVFSSILSEARKFRFSLILSHQFISQLEPETRDAVFGSIGTIVAFQLGSTDAEIMAQEYGEAFLADQFVDLRQFHSLVKPFPGDSFMQPFRHRTEIPGFDYTDIKDSIIRSSRERYGNEREKVEDKIKRWMQRWNE